MRLIKIILILALFIFGFSFSCDKSEYCEEKYKVTGYNVKINERKNNQSYTETTCQFLDSLDTIKYDMLVIDLYTETQKISTECTGNNINKIFFISNLYATEIVHILEGNIDNIVVKSDNDYNNFSDGDILNNIFKIVYQEKIITSPPSGVEYFTEEPISLNNFNDSNISCRGRYFLFLNSQPDTIELHTFTINIKHTDGKEFEAETIPFYIKP